MRRMQRIRVSAAAMSRTTSAVPSGRVVVNEHGFPGDAGKRFLQSRHHGRHVAPLVEAGDDHGQFGRAAWRLRVQIAMQSAITVSGHAQYPTQSAIFAQTGLFQGNAL